MAAKYQLHYHSCREFSSLDHLAYYCSLPGAYHLDLLVWHMLQSRHDVDLVSHCGAEEQNGITMAKTSLKPAFSRSGGTTYMAVAIDYLVLKNTDNGCFSVLDIQDVPGNAQQLQMEPGFAGALVSMYEPSWIHEHFACPELIEPYLFFDQSPNLVDSMREEIAEIYSQAQDDRLFIAATLGDDTRASIKLPDGRLVGRRHIARVLAERWPDEVLVLEPAVRIDRPEYWRMSAQHRWNLFLPGAPWCYREHECWRLGLATFSSTLWHPLKIALNPGEHYAGFHLPREEREYTGWSLHPEKHAELLIDAYRRVRDNHSLRRRIARSAQQRMERAKSTAVAAQTLHRLIEMTQ